jgi:hypothetical protein
MFCTNVWMRVTCSTNPFFNMFLPAFFGCDSCEKKPTVPEGTGTPRLVTIRTGNPENTASIQPKSQQCVAGTYQYPSTRQRAHALVAPGYFRYLYWTSKLHCRLLTTTLLCTISLGSTCPSPFDPGTVSWGRLLGPSSRPGRRRGRRPKACDVHMAAAPCHAAPPRRPSWRPPTCLRWPCGWVPTACGGAASPWRPRRRAPAIDAPPRA